MQNIHLLLDSIGDLAESLLDTKGIQQVQHELLSVMRQLSRPRHNLTVDMHGQECICQPTQIDQHKTQAEADMWL